MTAAAQMILVILATVLFSSCNFNYSETGKMVDKKLDMNELFVAKNSLKYISERKSDSLKLLFADDLLKMISPAQLDTLANAAKTTIDNSVFPSDNQITVTHTTSKAISGEVTFKQFTFPFVPKNNNGSLTYITIAIVGGKIHKINIEYPGKPIKIL